MTHSVTHLGPSDRPADADLLILHVESDESVRTEVATALTATGEDVDVVAVPSVEAAASLLADLRPDCLVVGTVATASFVEGVRPPVAVYFISKISRHRKIELPCIALSIFVPDILGHRNRFIV